jgi:type IV pilus assembly protein PilW
MTPVRHRYRQRAFSLVELMVALLLGSIVTLGLVNMFSATQQTYQVLQGQARLQEGARYALDFVARPLRMAGFIGCVSLRTVDVRSVLVGAPGFAVDANVPLQGYEATDDSPPTWSPALATLPAAIDTDAIVPGTDVLVVRHASTQDRLQLTATQVNPNSDLVTSVPAVAARYAAGTIALVSDCDKATLFQVSGNATAGGAFTIRHATGGGLVPGNATTTLAEDNTVFDGTASVYRVSTTVFFVAPGAGTNNRGNTPTSLWRSVDGAAPEELVEGVEDLQLSYGVDTDDDGAPNRYLTIQNVVDADDIVTVRVQMTVNSVDEISEFSADGLVRRGFETTVAIRNRLT